MQMDVGLDTGDMLYKLSCPITAEDTSGTLYDKLAELGPQGLITTLKQLADGTAKPEVQDETLVTYAEKLSKEEARIDWSLSAAQLERCIRAFNPWPMSWLEIEGQRLKSGKHLSSIRQQRLRQEQSLKPINKAFRSRQVMAS